MNEILLQRKKRKRYYQERRGDSGFYYAQDVTTNHAAAPLVLSKLNGKIFIGLNKGKAKTPISMKDVHLQGKCKKAEEFCPNTLDFGSTFLSAGTEDSWQEGSLKREDKGWQKLRAGRKTDEVP